MDMKFFEIIYREFTLHMSSLNQISHALTLWVLCLEVKDTRRYVHECKLRCQPHQHRTFLHELLLKMSKVKFRTKGAFWVAMWIKSIPPFGWFFLVSSPKPSLTKEMLKVSPWCFMNRTMHLIWSTMVPKSTILN